jgi:hypothetical protein
MINIEESQLVELHLPISSENMAAESVDTEDEEEERMKRGKMFTRQNTFTLAPSGDAVGFTSPRAQVDFRWNIMVFMVPSLQQQWHKEHRYLLKVSRKNLPCFIYFSNLKRAAVGFFYLENLSSFQYSENVGLMYSKIKLLFNMLVLYNVILVMFLVFFLNMG